MKRRTRKSRPQPRDLDDPDLFVNPNLARIRFMERVLEEAEDPTLPVLERAKFIAIFGSNLDEMFMIRIAELRPMRTTRTMMPRTMRAKTPMDPSLR